MSNEPPEDFPTAIELAERTIRERAGQPGRPAPGASHRPACCRRPPSGWTPAASCGPTRSGSASSGSTWTRRPSASSSAPTTGTATGSAQAVLDIVATRGKMQNPETGSGGMLVGTVEEVGPESPLGLRVGGPGHHAGVADPDAAGHRGRPRALGRPRPSRCPCDGYAVLFGRSIAAVIPDDLPAELSLSVMDVCGAPALTARRGRRSTTRPRCVAVIGGAGKSGSLSLAAAKAGRRGPHHRRRAAPGRGRPAHRGRDRRRGRGRRRPRPGRPLRGRASRPAGPADVTVVCVDVPGCEGGAILATADGGTVIFFSMATSFSAAALGAEGLAADVTMLVGNGYVPGHADFALVPAARPRGGARPVRARGCRGWGGVTRTPAPRWLRPHARRPARHRPLRRGRHDRLGRRRRRRRGTSPTTRTGSSSSTAGWSPRPSSTPTRTSPQTGFAATGVDLTGVASLPRRSTRSPRTPAPAPSPVLLGHGWDETALARAAAVHPRRSSTGPAAAAPVYLVPGRRALRGGLAPRSSTPARTIVHAEGYDAGGLVARDAHHLAREGLFRLTAAVRPRGRDPARAAGRRPARHRHGPRARRAAHLPARGPRRSPRPLTVAGATLPEVVGYWGELGAVDDAPSRCGCAGRRRRPVHGRLRRLAHGGAARAVRRRGRPPGTCTSTPGRSPTTSWPAPEPASRPASTSSATGPWPRSSPASGPRPTRSARAAIVRRPAPARARRDGRRRGRSRTLARARRRREHAADVRRAAGAAPTRCTPSASAPSAAAADEPVRRDAPRRGRAGLRLGHPGHAVRALGRGPGRGLAPRPTTERIDRRGRRSTRTPAAAGAPPGATTAACSPLGAPASLAVWDVRRRSADGLPDAGPPRDVPLPDLPARRVVARRTIALRRERSTRQ